MNQTTQQISPNPALDFAQSILDVTNNGLELVEILRDIAEDDENANTNDRITAADTLMDRAFGKRPKAALSQSRPKLPKPTTIRRGDSRIALCCHPTIARSDSPRLVTQVKDSLNQSHSAPLPQRSQSPLP